MFESLLPWLVIALTCLAAASASCIPVLLARGLPAAPSEDDSWRDEPPLLFRLLRVGVRRFTHTVDENLSADKREMLRSRLNEAGLGYTITPAELIVLRRLTVAIVTVIVAYFILMYRLFEPRYLLPGLGLLLLGYFYIDIWLRDAAKLRQRRIEKDLPFFLDVLVLSMKAGLAFPAALQQATTQLPDGPIKQELARLIREIRTGISRSGGLERLARRIRLASVSNFVAVVSQAEESGGSLTKALTEQARQRRRERFLRAEKLANQAPVKLLLPLVTLLFPVTFIILGFPLVKQMAQSGLFGLAQ